MEPHRFTAWVTAMKSAQLARSDNEIGELLGKSRSAVARFKVEGCDRTVALACNALINGLEVYE